MKSTLSLLLILLNQFFMPRHNAQLRLLKAQIAILRARIPTQRIILSPAEKAELLRIGAECGHEIDGLLEVAKPATYKRWLAQMRVGPPFKAVGRPRLTQELRDVVIRRRGKDQTRMFSCASERWARDGACNERPRRLGFLKREKTISL